MDEKVDRACQVEKEDPQALLSCAQVRQLEAWSVVMRLTKTFTQVCPLGDPGLQRYHDGSGAAKVHVRLPEGAVVFHPQNVFPRRRSASGPLRDTIGGLSQGRDSAGHHKAAWSSEDPASDTGHGYKVRKNEGDV